MTPTDPSCAAAKVTFSQIVTDLKTNCLTTGCHKAPGAADPKNKFFADPNKADDICNVLKTVTPAAGGKFLDKDPMVAQLYKVAAAATHSGGPLYKSGDKGKGDRVISWLKDGFTCP